MKRGAKGHAPATERQHISQSPSEMREPSPNGRGILLTDEERHRCIAEAAYLRAERRGFTPGYELNDWLEAEMEIAPSTE